MIFVRRQRREYRPHRALFACVGCGDRGLAIVLLLESTVLPQPLVPTTMAALCGSCTAIFRDATEGGR